MVEVSATRAYSNLLNRRYISRYAVGGTFISGLSVHITTTDDHGNVKSIIYEGDYEMIEKVIVKVSVLCFRLLLGS